MKTSAPLNPALSPDSLGEGVGWIRRLGLPPRGDPRRPLHLAIHSTRLLGIVLLIWGLAGMLPFMMYLSRGGRGGPMLRIFVAGSLFNFVPGALFMVFAIFLARRQRWAVMGALVLSSLLDLFLLLVLGAFAYRVISARDSRDLAMIGPLAIISLFALAIGLLIYQLSKSFEAVKYPPFGQEIRGFEPLPLRSVVPTPPVDPAPPASP